MKISPEELEKIKQSNKAKTFGDEKYQNDEFIDDNEDDENFIDDQNLKTAQEKRESIYKRLKSELAKAAQKLRNAIKPIKTELRSLDKEVGGLEANYQEIGEINNNDVDVWDDQTKKISEAAIQEELQDEEENKSFIHMVKTGFGKKGKKRRRGMGQVDLGKAALENEEAAPKGFVAKLKGFKEDGQGTQNNSNRDL